MRFLHYTYKFMKLGGLLPLEKDCSVLLRLSFYLLRVFNLLLITWTVVIALFYYVNVRRTIDEFLLLMNAMVFIGAIIRLALYYSHDYKTFEIINTMNELFKDTSDTGMEEKSIYPYVFVVNTVCLCWGICTYFVVNLFFMFPIFTGKDPMPVWYPYNSSMSPYLEISYAFEFLSQNSMCYNYNMVDIFYISVVVLTAGQFNILAWELENVCFSSLIDCGFEKNRVLSFKEMLSSSNHILDDASFYDIYVFMQTNRYALQLQKNLTSIIEFHINLIKFCNELENFWSITLLFTFMGILGHCVLILYGISMSESITHYLRLAVYFIAAITEALFIAYPSDFLLQEAKKLQYSLYSTSWYLCPKETKSIFKFCHFHLNSRIRLTLGKFTVFDLKAYGWVMKTSFSYFMVLRGAQEEY